MRSKGLIQILTILLGMSSFSAAQKPGTTPAPAASLPPSAVYAKLPLTFEANRGQAPDQYAYVAHGPTYSLGLSVREIALSLHRPQAVSQRYTAHPALD